MLDTIFWIIAVGYLIYLVYSRTTWFKDFEKEYEKLAKELREDAEEDKKHAEKFSKHSTSQEMAKESELRFRHFVKTHDDYLHLKERFRHNEKTSEIKSDWQAYIKAIKDLLESRMDYAAGVEGKLLQNAWGRDYKAKIVLVEIEKRFHKYLRG